MNIPVSTAAPVCVYSTPHGQCYQADSRAFLPTLPDESVDLVLTSPPYPLHRQKEYGNVSAEEFCDWFWPFALEIHRVLAPEGSFVLDLAGAWKRGGMRSLYQYELIVRLGRIFHLAQEFYWHNPSRLPGPAEYVTRRRTRVKDTVNTLWWLCKGDAPRADNRRVLKPYSGSMRRLLREGVQPARRPSQHQVTKNFEQDNGGAIPPNFLEIPNSVSRDEYLRRCREAGLPIHPTRFPRAIPEFFIRFLTESGDLILDPFAGSNVTGQVAEQLGRRWLACEIRSEYVRSSELRFDLQEVEG